MDNKPQTAEKWNRDQGVVTTDKEARELARKDTKASSKKLKLQIQVPEFHQKGTLSIENLEEILSRAPSSRTILEVDVGLMVSKDGRIWVCVDGIAFLRFKPTKP